MAHDRLIAKYSAQYGIPADLLRAVIQVESGGNPWAIRYEPRYRWLYNDARPVRGVSADTEREAQKTSWGLMQVMGAVARERGFDKPFLSELCDPSKGMEYGCKHLAAYYRRHGDWERAVVSYNAGSPRRREDGRWVNQAYLDKIRAAGWSGDD